MISSYLILTKSRAYLLQNNYKFSKPQIS
uniref:Uncharacterized protein n=1 Tax=Lepeophtheirus salmonis TaxID=72036 RepID=A0A0K2UHQ6_LEPSM